MLGHTRDTFYSHRPSTPRNGDQADDSRGFSDSDSKGTSPRSPMREIGKLLINSE